MKQKSNALLQKLVTFDGKISEANRQILSYSGSSTGLSKEVSELVGQLAKDIETTQGLADDAYKKWRDFTIAAVTVSVGLMILSAGLLWPLAVGAATGLGIAAANQRKAYNSFLDKVKELNVDKQKKSQLLTDLSGLNSSVATVAPAIGEFRSNLEAISGVWNDVGMNLAYIVNNYGVSNLADLSWVMQTLGVLEAQKKWGEIATTTQQFTQNSLVSFDTGITFGQPLPAMAA